MKKQLITLETAKLAKEKGLSQEPSLEFEAYATDWSDKITNQPSLMNERDNIAVAPTQSLLQRWLREKHNIDIIIEPGIIHKADKCYCYRVRFNMNCAKQGGVAHTYEEALEAGLQEGLKLINP